MKPSETFSSSPSDSPIDLPSRSARSSISEQTRTKARRSKDANSMRDVARVLVARERETMDLKRTLHTLSEQLKAERQRADAAESKTREVLALFKSANEAKIMAEQEAARANEGLRLYKLQYENAQEEIRRAQKLIDALEGQRVDAEAAAAEARSKMRKLKEEKIVMRAREEGRRLGLEEGMAQGRVMGYEQGKAEGYEHGRAAAEREFTSAPVTEMEYETPRAKAYQPPRMSRPSTSEDSEPRSVQNYTQPLDNSAPIQLPVTTPARIPTPAQMPVVDRRPEGVPIRPISAHNILSPPHPPVDVPPEGWIPKIDEDNRIRLPPPHEMGRPPPTTPSPPLSAVLNNVRSIPEEPVMIPPPSNQEPEQTSRQRRPRRRNSAESESTTMSQFEILGPPSTAPSTLRMPTRERPSVLSAIAEERERTSSASSPVYGMPNLSTQSFQMPLPSPGMPVASPHQPPQMSPQPPPQTSPRPPSQIPSYEQATPRYQTDENIARSTRPEYPDLYKNDGSGERNYEGYYRLLRGEPTPRSARADGPPPPPPPREDSAYGRHESGDHTPRSTTSSDAYRYQSANLLPRMQNIYAPPHSPHSSPSDTPTSRTPAIVAPTPSVRLMSTHPPPPENRGSMSSNEIGISVEPPSRPESNMSRTDAAERSLLSAEDADRPLPSVPEAEKPTAESSTPTNPVIPPPIMLSGPWPPPGFVPMGPPSPVGGSTVGPAGIPLPPSMYGGSTVGPAGIPLPPSVYGGTPSVRSEAVPGVFPGPEDPPPVIPLQRSNKSSQSSGSHKKGEPYTRAPIRRRDDDSESSVSSGLGSVDSLTTPPARTRKLSGRSTPAYATAPIPPSVAYPAPPTPRSSTSNSLGSHTGRAARVPLPASVAGSVSGSIVGGPPGRSGSVASGTRPPSSADRPRSPMMGGGRNLSSPSALPISLPEPVIPIPIPEPTPITMPVPFSPARPTTPLADIEPVPIVPAVARVPSPVASAVSAATTNMTTNTRGGKRGRKKR